jgi:ABC-type phosphate transport system auxiliary subunit
MELETKFYELQDRYQTLINDYEQLKEKYEKDSLGHRDELGSRYDPFVRNSGH